MTEENRKSSFWVRAGAFAVDGFLLSFILQPLEIIGGILVSTGYSTEKSTESFVDYASIGLVACLFLLYETFFVSSRHKSTVGQMIFKLQVMSTEQTRLSIANAFWRSLCRLINFFFCFLILPIFVNGFLMARHGRALHDYAAKSCVMERKTSLPKNL